MYRARVCTPLLITFRLYDCHLHHAYIDGIEPPQVLLFFFTAFRVPPSKCVFTVNSCYHLLTLSACISTPS